MPAEIKKSHFIFIFSFILIFNFQAAAHCDSMEGPVVKASQKALETGNINYVLIWVKPEGEQEVRSLFDRVLRVRVLNEEARDLADNYFYETVVRIHRMGEGEPYTGIEPVGYKPPEGIEAADHAVDGNSIEPVLSIIDEKHHAEVKELFAELQSKQNYTIDDVKAGREYVEAYVHFIHFVEELSGGEAAEQHME